MKKRSRHWETLSRVERDEGSATLIDATKKNENLSVITQCCLATESHDYNVDIFAADVLCHHSCHVIIALFIVMRRKVPQKLQ